jgi:hypothetical protein
VDRIIPKLDPISIYQAMEYVKHLFHNPLFVDELLMEFIVLRIREAKNAPQVKERSGNIIRGLMNDLKSKEESI